MTDARTIDSAFGQALAYQPDALFLDYAGARSTYAQLDREVDRLARGLHRFGVGAGQPVLCVLDNGPDALISWLALDRLGAVSVPLTGAEATHSLARIVADCGARAAIVESGHLGRSATLWNGVPGLAVVLHTGGRQEASPRPGRQIEPLDAHRLDTGEVPRPERGPGDVAVLCYSDASGEEARGCMVTQGQLSNVAYQMLEITRRRPEETHWTAAPILRTETLATTVLPSMLLGACVSIAPPSSLREFWAEIQRTGARLASLTGQMMAKIGLSPESADQLSCRGQLRVVIGACPPPEMQDLWSSRFGVDVPGVAAYWRPEAGILTAVPCGEYAAPGSLGKRDAAFDTRIFDEDDNELPPGRVGEIVCRPRKPHVMFGGYWNRPEATLNVTRNMWFHTGDFGRFDGDGFLYRVEQPTGEIRAGSGGVASLAARPMRMITPRGRGRRSPS